MKARTIIFLIITIALMLVIFIHSAMSASVSSAESSVLERMVAGVLHTDPDNVTYAVRKCAHFVEYLVLGLFLMLTARSVPEGGSPSRRGHRFWIAWLIGLAYAVSDEVHQLFVPGRSCEVRDVCIDAAGVLCGVLIVWAVRRRRAQGC